MSLSGQVNVLYDHIKDQQSLNEHNQTLFNIYEGDLLGYVMKALQNQLSAQSFDIAKTRIPPINVLVRLIDKLSKIYQQGPVRNVSTEKESDKNLLNIYERSMNFNSQMNGSNEFYNLFKNNLVQPYLDPRGMPALRTISSDKFTVYSDSQVSPTEPTHVITFHTSRDNKGNSCKVYYVYTDTEFMVFDDDKNIRTDLMASMGMEDGVNPVGRIPFVYINKSKNLLIPKPDTDTKEMTILLPVMLADLNFATMMQAFSILYGIDVSDKGIVMSPSAFWTFKSEVGSDKTPQIGVLKPQVDIAETLNLCQAEVSMWLQTRGIKPGAVGKLTSENFASGISKMIDEMDTSEERQKQVSVYTDAERKFWELTTQFMHPYWRKLGKLETSLNFSSDLEITTNFQEQLPLLNRGELVKDLDSEVKAGFTTRRRAIQRLNPRMTDSEIDDLIREIETEQTENRVIENNENREV